MRYYLSTLLLVLTGFAINAQFISSVTYPDTTQAIIVDGADPSVMLANSITDKDLFRHLSVLASDEYEGRETGTKGNRMSASYIANQFKEMGLPTVGENNSYFQGIAFNKTSWKRNVITVNGKEYRHLWDYLAFAALNENQPYIKPDEVIFLGYGIDDPKYNDYKGRDLTGKVILINQGEPMDKNGVSRITGTAEMSEWSEDVFKKLKLAKDKGVKHVFIIESNIQKFLGENRKFLVSPNLELGDGQYESSFANHSYISSTIAKEMIGSKARKMKRWRRRNLKRGKTTPLALKPDFIMNYEKEIAVTEGNNVLGYIEGTDKKDELVIVSAHHDHLGKRNNDVYNGADDNGSGTSTVLEIAEAFQLAKEMGVGPRRSVLCLLVTGEEKGLLGSKYYGENPIFPLENTVVNVNIDMVGRVADKYKENPNYIYVIGSDRLSTDLHKINETANQKYSQLVLDYKFNSEQDPNRYYYRSDHYTFAKKGIPAIFFFNGTHDDYHRTSDTIEKIEFDVLEKRGRLFFHTAWELANRDDKIIVDGVVEEDN